MLAEYTSTNTLLKNENIQLKKENSNLEQQIAQLNSEQDPVFFVKMEPTSVKGLSSNYTCNSHRVIYMHVHIVAIVD